MKSNWRLGPTPEWNDRLQADIVQTRQWAEALPTAATLKPSQIKSLVFRLARVCGQVDSVADCYNAPPECRELIVFLDGLIVDLNKGLIEADRKRRKKA